MSKITGYAHTPTVESEWEDGSVVCIAGAYMFHRYVADIYPTGELGTVVLTTPFVGTDEQYYEIIADIREHLNYED